jgi:hypothetical protein
VIAEVSSTAPRRWLKSNLQIGQGKRSGAKYEGDQRSSFFAPDLSPFPTAAIDAFSIGDENVS